jgi:hypothetical protein
MFAKSGTADDVINQYKFLRIYFKYAVQFLASQNICPLYVHPIRLHTTELSYLLINSDVICVLYTFVCR